MNYFVLNESINSRTDLGLRITKPPVIPVSKRIVNSIEVDGREGTLTMLRGWEDVKFQFNAGLLGSDSNPRFTDILPTILDSTSIYFSSDKSVNYNVKFVECERLEQRVYSLFEFRLTFTCSPFRYMRNVAPITLTSSGNVANIGTVYSLPKITVYGTGNRTLTVNGKAVNLNILQGSLTLDSELKICYFGNVAQNQNMQGEFPILEVGGNAITLGAGISRVEIEPRWRHL